MEHCLGAGEAEGDGGRGAGGPYVRAGSRGVAQAQQAWRGVAQQRSAWRGEAGSTQGAAQACCRPGRPDTRVRPNDRALVVSKFLLFQPNTIRPFHAVIASSTPASSKPPFLSVSTLGEANLMSRGRKPETPAPFSHPWLA
jgi:hypothetical protein